jgi:cellulose synthase/poly-beta-1,6-N-acetylglucosamine synthase-like glycosyltransferase
MLLISFVVYITAYFGLLTAGFFLLTYFADRDKIADPVAKRFPFVSFVVPVFNEQDSIRDTINSLLNADYPKSRFEIIVVDDGSTDNTYKVLKRLKSKIVRIFTKENGGCPTALNMGIRKARGELIARFDADTILARDSLKKMIGYFDNPKVIAVTSSLNVNNHRGFLQRIQWAEYLFGIVLRKIFDLNDSIHVIPGPLSIYRAEFFRKYGGFDETNITEDTEMAMRIQSHGYEIRNSISASVYTNVPVNFKSLLRQRIRWYTGFMYNSINYRHLYDVKRRTNLSTFILPIAVTSVFLAFFSFFVMMYYNIEALKDEIIRISVAGFSIHDWLRDINTKTITESLVNYATSKYIFFVILGILLMLLFFSISKYYSGEKRGIFLAVVLYFLFYIFFFLLWWSAALFYFITGKEQTWGRRRYKRAKLVI